MSYSELLPILVTAVSLITSFSYLLQAREIIQNHSSRNVSLVEYVIISGANVLWFLYGIQLSSIPLMITSVVAWVFSGAVVVVELHFRRKRELTISLGSKD